MSLLTDFTTMFGKKPAQPSGQPQNQQPAGNQQQQPNSLETANQSMMAGNVPGGAQQNNNSNPQGNNQPAGGGNNNGGDQNSPLDQFKELWQTGANSDPAKATADQQKAADRIKNRSEKIKAAAKSLDYSRVIKPELAQKALSGDVNSFMQILNAVGQSSFAHALSQSHLHSDEAFSEFETSVFSKLPTELRKHQAMNTTLEGNSALNHPSIRPLVEGVQQQLTAAFPDATPAEIHKKTLEYFQATGKLFANTSGDGKNPGSGEDSAVLDERQQMAAGTYNWENF